MVCATFIQLADVQQTIGKEIIENEKINKAERSSL